MGTRRRIPLLGCVLIFGLIFQTGLSLGADVGKGGKPSGTIVPAVPEKSKASSLPAKSAEVRSPLGVKAPLGAKLLPPDLVVSDIGLDGKCRVVLGVRNKGKGPVSDEAFRRGQIRVEVVAERRQELIPFTKADSTGALKAPGGAVKVVSGLVLERKTKDDLPQQVNAEVDSTRQIEESDEDNIATKKFKPSCWAGEVKGIEGIGGGKEEGLGGAKGFGKKDGDAGRVGVKRLASGGISVPGGKRNRDEDGCPLVVEELVASGSEVVVILGRKGAAGIEPAEAAKIQLLVLAGAQRREWSLKEIEKGLQRHKGSGELWDFATGLELEKAGPVMVRLVGCEGRALTRMLSPSDEGKAPGVAKMVPRPEPGGGDEREAAVLGDARMRADAVRPGPEEGTPTIASPESTLASAGSVTDRVMPYPARITSVSDPVYPGGTITIRGVDFGARQGQVKLVMIPHPYAVWLTCDIVSWTGELVQAVIPEHVAGHISSLRDARIYLYPARVEEQTSPPLSTGGEDATRYPYSGNEGPSYPFQIQPLTPSIGRVSPSEVDEGGEFEISGLRFGNEPGSGGIVLDGGPRNIPVDVVEWRETRIRVRVPITALAGFSEDAVRGELRVTNKHRLEAAGASVTVNRVDDIDLKVAGVQVSGWDNECGRWDGTAGGLNDVCFDITPTVRNDGTDNAPGYHLEVTARPMGTKIYITTYDRATGPVGGAETVLDAKAANCGDSTCDLTFNIPRRDTCTIRIHGNGTYPRPATCPD